MAILRLTTDYLSLSASRRVLPIKTFSLSRYGLLILIAFAVFTSLCQATPHTEKLKFDAQKYYWGRGAQQDFTKAFKLYLEAAELGDAEAKYIAGGMYFKGIGTERNLRSAFSLLYGAALQGNSTVESQNILGQFFLTGMATPKNYAEAMRWYKLSAENGNRDSQSELAFLYFIGRGVARDFEKSFYWFEKSAMQGLAVSQYSVGIMYYTGNGVEKSDSIKAYAWFNLAAAQGHPDAAAARDVIESFLNQEELNQAQEYTMQLFQQIPN
jgi:hypothetical protein